MEILQLYEDGFDSLENRNPKYSELIATFVPSPPLTVQGVADNFISKMKPVKIHLGYDGEIYPKFRLEKVITNPEQ